jgi:hypothetical protein
VLKKTISYKDFNGDPVTEDLFFHLSQAELVELEVGFQPDGLAVAMQKMLDAQDGKAIVSTFKDIVLKAYGKKSSDGKRFIKNSLIREEFESSKAWETIFMELVTEPDKMNEFVIGIIPAELVAQTEELAQKVETKPAARHMTMAEVKALSEDDVEAYRDLVDEIVHGRVVVDDD